MTTAFEPLPPDVVRAKLAPKRWSYSSLNSFHDCPFSFYQRYVLDQYPPLPNTFFGNAFHEWVEHHLQGEDLDVPKLLAKWHVEDRAGDFGHCVGNALRWIPRHIGSAKFMNEMELHFVLVDGSWVYLPGGIEASKAHPSPYKFMIKCDLVVLYDGGKLVSVFDFKTSKDASYFSSHLHQMATYRDFLNIRLPGVEVKTFLFYPNVNQTISTNPHLEGKFVPGQALTDVIKEVDTILANTDWSPSCNQWCKTCAFKPKCPLFALDEPKLGS